MSPQSKPSIVFCHGIWADGSCFSKLIPPLRADGHEVIAGQYNLDSCQSDVDSVIRTLGRVSSPSILVGHSYGGAVITAAGTDDRVAGLVYISALAPDETETPQGQQDKFPTTDVFGQIEVADGRIWMLPDGIESFAGDLSEEEKQFVWATATPPAANLFNEKVPGAAGGRSPAPTSWPRRTTPLIPSWSGSRRAHGCHDVRSREQPRPDALAPRHRARRDPQPRDHRPGSAATAV